jgi:DNA-binding CsgD family transcriptional regulator
MSDLGWHQARGDELTDTFVGRDDEVQLLASVVASVEVSGSAGVVTGEVGIGKTALLRRAARTAGADVVWVRGREAESVLPFASAADLLTPMHRHFAELPPSQRRALEVALAMADGPSPGDLAVCAGAFGVLSGAAAVRPLVILVDNLQWIDAESRQLLLFVARRITTQRVVMLFSTRSETGVEAMTQGLPVVRLEGLTYSECGPLARASCPDISDEELAELVLATGGNPQALLDSLAHRDLAARHPDGISVGSDVRRAWGQILAPLPRRTRDSLFAVAAAETPCLPVPAVLDALGLSLLDLEPAEHLGVVTVEGDRLMLASPILGHVLADTTPVGVRLSTYRALAELAEPEQRGWLLAKAAIGPDDAIAQELVDAADEARMRGGHASAAQLVKRAAELTSEPHERAGRLLKAATDSLLAGRAAQADRWLLDAMSLQSAPAFVAAATTMRGRALMWMGQAREAVDQLLDCADAMESVQPEATPRLLREALMPMAMTGDVRECLALARHSDRLARVEDASFHEQVMVAAAYLIAGDVATGRDRRELAERSLVDADTLVDQQAMVILAQVRWWAGDFDGALGLVSATIESVRRQGSSAVLPMAFAVRSEVSMRTGRWESAYADAQESVRWATDLHQPGILGYGLSVAARIEAARGQQDLCEERVESSRRDAGTSVAGSLVVYESAVLGLAALAAGEPVHAVEHLSIAWQHARAQGLGHPDIVPFAGDLIEALVRCARLEEATEVLAWLETAARTTGLPQVEALAHRGRGLLAEDPAAAAAAFEDALSGHDRCPMPFERARTLLCAGERLRRARQGVEARRPLREAQRIFEGLGARPWADRAAVEIAASGARAHGSTASTRSGVDQLTAQELQISRAVACGKNNVEVAAALFLSRKTVEAHLTRIYRRLGIGSRTELTRAIVESGIDLDESEPEFREFPRSS